MPRGLKIVTRAGTTALYLRETVLVARGTPTSIDWTHDG